MLCDLATARTQQLRRICNPNVWAPHPLHFERSFVITIFRGNMLVNGRYNPVFELSRSNSGFSFREPVFSYIHDHGMDYKLSCWSNKTFSCQNVAITTKAGLLANLRNLKWFADCDCGEILPRGYDLSIETDVLVRKM